MSASALGLVTGRVASAARRVVAQRMPLSVLQWWAPRPLVAFSYHLVADDALPHVKRIYNYKTTAEFEADVIYLKRQYWLPTWPDFLAAQTSDRRPARQAAMLTFDDGMSQCFEHVRPILLRHQVPCVFFVSPDFVDNRVMFYRHKVALCLERIDRASADEQARLLRVVGQDRGVGEVSAAGFALWLRRMEIVDEAVIDRVCGLLGVDVASALAHLTPYMTTAEIRRMADDGFTIGGHTMRHARLQLLGREAREREIVESCERVRQLTGARDVPFAFPFGGAGIDRGELRELVARHPWIRMIFDTGGLLRDEPFVIHRIAADEPSGQVGARSGIERVIRDSYADVLSGRAAARREATR